MNLLGLQLNFCFVSSVRFLSPLPLFHRGIFQSHPSRLVFSFTKIRSAHFRNLVFHHSSKKAVFHSDHSLAIRQSPSVRNSSSGTEMSVQNNNTFGELTLASFDIPADPLVQYVVVRRDLLDPPLNWPTGSVIAQAVHASALALTRFAGHPDTRAYLSQGDGERTQNTQLGPGDGDSEGKEELKQRRSNLEQMRTVVLQAKKESDLVKAAKALQDDGMDAALWIEHPEEIHTALAARPYRKSEIAKYFKKFNLFK